jgi:hypothetical protein
MAHPKKATPSPEKKTESGDNRRRDENQGTGSELCSRRLLHDVRLATMLLYDVGQ